MPFEESLQYLKLNNITITGSLHVGAHECEEFNCYVNLGINPCDMLWIDAIPSKVAEASARGIPNVYNAVITDTDDDLIIFNISNNVQSSSVLELGTHLQEHPEVKYVYKLTLKSITIDTFFERNKINASKYNLWNFDIQGAELMALKGATNSIKYAEIIILEVNEKELYKNCGLIGDIDNFFSDYNFKRVFTKILEYGWGEAVYIRQNELK